MHIESIRNRGAGGTSHRTAQSMGTELTRVEGKEEEKVQIYGRQIRVTGFPQERPRDQDKVSEELYEQLQLAKARNQDTIRDADTSFNRPEGWSSTLERVPLPKFGRKPETWADFRSGFKAILGTCEPAIEMVRLRNAMPQAANKFIMGVTEPAEAWSVLDRQYGNRDMAIACIG